MNAQSTIIDADGHIVEPPALWQEYVELAFRDRIPQVVKDVGLGLPALRLRVSGCSG